MLNEYDEILKQQDQSAGTALRQTMLRAEQSTPERTAEVIKLSGRTGLPEPIIQRNFEAVQKRAASEGDEYDKMVQQSPKLVEWLKEGENAALARDEIAKLGGLEWVFSAAKRAMSRGFAQVDFGHLRTESIYRDLTAAEQHRLAFLREEMGRGGDLGAETWFGKALTGAAQQLPILFGGLLSGAQTGVPAALGAAGAAGLAGQLGPQVALPEEIATMPAAAAIGYYVGSTAGSARFMYRQEAGMAYEEFSKFKDELGKPLDNDVARAAAIAAGGINAGLEVFQLNLIMRTIPGADKLFGGMTRNAIAEALKVPTVRSSLKNLMMGYGKTLTLETTTEVAQRAVTILAGELGKFASGQQIEKRGGSEVVRDLVDEGIQAAQAFSLIVAPGHVMQGARDAMKIREAKKNEAFFQALGGEMAESKMLQRLPEKMAEYVERVTKDGPIERLFVPVESWQTYWQGKGLDPAKVADQVLGDTKPYEEAQTTGNIVIPTSRYATLIAPTEHNTFFAKEIRLGPDELNSREAVELEKQIAEESQRAAQDQATAQAETVQQITDRLTEMLVETGMERKTAETNALLNAQVLNAIGTRSGVDPMRMAEQIVEISRQGVPQEGETTLDQVKDLFIHHNVTEQNLMHAARMGGLPVPSLAISRADQPLAGFGEITLIGPREMADPRGYAKTRVYGADIFSPRYPPVHWKVDKGGQEVLAKVIRAHRTLTGRNYFDLDELQQRGPLYLQDYAPVKAAFLREKGIELPTRVDGDKIEADRLVDHALDNEIRGKKLTQEFWKFTEELFKQMRPTERIFRGHDAMGRKRFIPHTLDNVVRILKKDLRGGETVGNLYGIGQLRAKFTPQFKSVKAIQKGKDKLVSHDEFVAIRDEMTEELFAIENDMAPYYEHGRANLRTDTVLAVIEDSVRLGLDRAAAEYGFKELPPDVRIKLYGFVMKLKNMPTEYFEAKILREVDIGEFKAAVLPDTASKAVKDYLASRGVQTFEFPVGTQRLNDEQTKLLRRDAIKKAAETLGDKILFQGRTIDGSTGEIVPQPWYYSQLQRMIGEAKFEQAPAPQWASYIKSLSTKGVKQDEINLSGVLDWLEIVQQSDATRWRVVSKETKQITDETTEARKVMEWKKQLGDAFEIEVVERDPAKPRRISKDDVLDYLRMNSVEVKEVRLGDKLPEPERSISRLPSTMAVTRIADVRTLTEHILSGKVTPPPVGHTWAVVNHSNYPTDSFVLEGTGRTKEEAVQDAIKKIEAQEGIVPLPDVLEMKSRDEIDKRDRVQGHNYYVVDTENGDEVIASGATEREAHDAAIEWAESVNDESGPSDDDVRERAQKLLDEDIPELARDYARDSDYANQTFSVRLLLPNFEVVEIEEGLFGGGKKWGVKYIDWGLDSVEVNDDDARKAEGTLGWPMTRDEFDDWKDETYGGEGPEMGWATDTQFASYSEARQWALHHKFETDHGRDGYDDEVTFELWDDENGESLENEESFKDASGTADAIRESRYESEVDYYTSDGAPTLDDFGDRYINQAREELEDEGEYKRFTLERPRSILKSAREVTPTRHPRSWQSDGGFDYREIALWVPNVEPFEASDSMHFSTDSGGRTVAWVRFKTHEAMDGTQTLFIEEIQSRRGEEGLKRGFTDEPVDTFGWTVKRRMAGRATLFDVYNKKGKLIHTVGDYGEMSSDEAIEQARKDIEAHRVPPAPFVKETQSWAALALKRVLRYAVDNGFKQIAWTQGEQQVKRYLGGLRSRVDKLVWTKTEKGVEIKGVKDDETVVHESFKSSELGAAIGAPMAQRIINDEGQSGEIAGEEIVIDDLGMARFYGDADGLKPDGTPSIVKIVAEKVLKQVGPAKVSRVDVNVREHNEIFQGAPGFTINDEQASRIQSGFTLFQQAEQGPRGSIRFNAAREFKIALLEGANLSTFAHESGHFWLEALGDVVEGLRNASGLNDQQRRMIEDYDKLLAWLGAPNRAGITVEHHEKWARAVETFLGEGNSPSIELRTVFARFRAWIIAIYRSLTQLDVKLNDEVRDIMGRLMATDEQIAAAEQEASITPIFMTAEDASMTEREFSAYKDDIQKAADQARDQLQQKIMKQKNRERADWWKHERESVRSEVESELGYQREHVALSALQKGVMPNGEELAADMQGIKLDRDSIVSMRGTEFLKVLPRPYVYSREKAIHPNAAAELFGFTSGDELLDALVATKPYRIAVEQETSNRMKVKHGDMLLDGSLADEARLAVANESRSQIIEAEMKALVKKQRLVSPHLAAERAAVGAAQQSGVRGLSAPVPPLAVIRQIAQGRIAQMRVRDILPQTYMVAARKAGNEALKAAAKNDFSKAIMEKQRQLMNLELYREAEKARDAVDEAVDYVHTFGENRKRSRIAKAGADYLDQIDALIDRYEFARVPLASLDKRKSLAAWIAEKERQGQSVNLPDEVVQEARRVNYKDLTYDELTGVTDSIKHIEHLAKFKNRLIRNVAKRELEEVVEEVSTSIRDNATSTRGRRIETRLPQNDAARLASQWFASHRKLSSIIRQLDGFKDGGAAWEHIMRAVNEAGDKEAQMNADAAKQFVEIFKEAYPGAEASELYVKARIPAINESLSKMARIMVALNWGNTTNRQRIMTGYEWNEGQVQAILDTLDERDWKFVQKTWDYINEFWPEIEAKEKRVNGIAPEKVEATPVSTRFGEFRGGYFPIKYDDRQSAGAYAHRISDLAEQMMSSGYTRATTRRGHTKERVEKVSEPVRLDFGVIFEHVNQVIHDVSHHEMLLDVNRILRSKKVQQTIIEVYGDVVFKEINNAIADIAAGDVPAIGAFEKVINWTRSGVTIAGLGWNVTTSLLQPFGLAQSMVRVGPTWIAKGINRWARDAVGMENSADFIREKSTMMRHRMNTQLREINEIRNTVGLNTGRLSGWVDEALRTVSLDKVTKQAVVDSYFWLIYKGQQVADIPTWLGAYEKALADPANDEARAIALADQAVLDSQGGGMIKDLAGVQRGGPLLRLWTNFYSYFNVTWNLSVEAARRTNYKDPVSVGRLAVDMIMLYTVPATLVVLLKHMLVGPDDEDPERLINKLIRENISYMFGVMIGLRELGSVIQGYHGYEGPAGTRFFSALSNLVKQIEQGEIDAAFWKSINEAAGIVLHYPAGQVRRTVEGFVALQEGQTRNPMALLVGAPKQ